ncbi:hypothetical protein VKT23_015303 [Stygiomarasmius scandens]|uniref:Uncharacterized protein n=1 Tax=Marasmiellus scandens TaxID=2682957 RepID=A0ABR1J177_9AGAR
MSSPLKRPLDSDSQSSMPCTKRRDLVTSPDSAVTTIPGEDAPLDPVNMADLNTDIHKRVTAFQEVAVDREHLNYIILSLAHRLCQDKFPQKLVHVDELRALQAKIPNFDLLCQRALTSGKYDDIIRHLVIPPRRDSPLFLSSPEFIAPQFFVANVAGWSRNFVGDHHHLLLQNITKMHARKVELLKLRKDQTDYRHLNQAALIQSSGSGKSRMVDELAKLIPAIPINLRSEADDKQYAYPPPDASLRDLFIPHPHFPTHDHVLQMRFYRILIAIFNSVNLEMGNLMQGKDWSNVSEFAQAWHHHLESDDRVHRQELYKKTKAVLDAKSSVASRPAEENRLDLLAVQANASLELLCKTIRKLGLKEEELHLVLYIDEVGGFTDKTVFDFSGVAQTALQPLLSVLSKLTHPIFVIYISTQSDTTKLASSAQQVKSARFIEQARHLNAPITETPFDCVGKPILVRQLTLSLLSNPVFLSLLGRPLWHSMMIPFSQRLLKYVQGDSQEQEFCVSSNDEEMIQDAFGRMIYLARCKLLNSTHVNDRYLSEIDYGVSSSPSLTAKMAIIGVRLMPVVDASHTLARELVASHMQTVFSIPQNREWIRSGYPSEPILAEAASWQVRHWRTKREVGKVDCMLDMLHTHLKSDLLSPGEIGEVTGRMILLTARDHAGYHKDLKESTSKISSFLPPSGHVLLTAFITELFPNDVTTAFLHSKAPNDPEGRSFGEAFEHDVINFTHWERFVDASATPKALLCAFMRGSAIFCHSNSPYIDAIIPVLRRKNVDDDTLNEKNMTAVLVQFKLRKNIRITAESVELVQPNEDTSRPYIVLVMELSIDTTLFSKTPTQRKSKAGRRLKEAQTANPAQQLHPASSTQRAQAPSTLGSPMSAVVTRNCAPKLIHPRYIIFVRGCSDSVYKVVQQQERNMYESLLRKSALLGDHPRQDSSTIQKVWQQKPFVSENKASYHWTDVYGDVQLPEDDATDPDTTDYFVGVAAEALLHPKGDGEKGMDEEVEGEERMDEEEGGETGMDEEEEGKERMDEEEGGETGMDEEEEGKERMDEEEL